MTPTIAFASLLAAAFLAATSVAIVRAAALRGCDEPCVITLAEGGR